MIFFGGEILHGLFGEAMRYQPYRSRWNIRPCLRLECLHYFRSSSSSYLIFCSYRTEVGCDTCRRRLDCEFCSLRNARNSSTWNALTSPVLQNRWSRSSSVCSARSIAGMNLLCNIIISNFFLRISSLKRKIIAINCIGNFQIFKGKFKLMHYFEILLFDYSFYGAENYASIIVKIYV